MIRGSVDLISATEVHGWAYGPAHQVPVLVQAVLNQEILGEAPASIHRADLAAAGLGNGRSGYVIKLRRPIDPLYLPFLTVKVDGGDTELPRAPMLGFADFFTSLYAAHPAAGRGRSVFGGLWTDRTDAAALLRGKTACGQIAASPILSQLITTGFAFAELPAAPSQPEFHAALADQVLAFLRQEAMLAPLRAILEDDPLAINTLWQTGEDAPFTQPSAKNPSPSQAECLEIIIAFGDGVVLDIVRDSFALPEFTPHGASRWRDPAATITAAAGFLDRHNLPPTQAAIISPGTIFRPRCTAGSVAIRILCLPTRGLPATLTVANPHADTTLDAPIRIFA